MRRMSPLIALSLAGLMALSACGEDVAAKDDSAAGSSATGGSNNSAPAKDGGSITVRGCTPHSVQHQRDLRRKRPRRRHRSSHPLQLRHRQAGDGHRRVHRDQGQPELHRQDQAWIQVLRRHRGQGQELRRRLELGCLRPERPAVRLLLRADRGLRRRAV